MTTQAKRRSIAMLILSLMTAAVPTKAQAASLEFRGDTVYISGNLTTDDLVKIDDRRGTRTRPRLIPRAGSDGTQ